MICQDLRSGCWLAARSANPTKWLTSLPFAPRSVSLQTLIRIAGTRYTVEQCIEEAKGEVGFDQYEVRHYGSWYRHLTLALMAHTWLAAERLRQREKNSGSARRTDRARSAPVIGGGLTSG